MKRLAACALAAVCGAGLTPHVQSQGLAPATVVPVSVNGDPAARFSLVVMSDGYTATELPKYRAHLDKHLNVLWSIEPFRSYRNYINVYSVEIVSPESGVTCDPDVRKKVNTPLGANFTGGCENPNARGILVNQNAAREFAKQATPHFDQILVITNTDTYGGIGGAVATTSGGNSLGVLITPHELGHSLGKLQDEYTYRERGVPGGTYQGGEPPSVHHTLLTEEQMRAAQQKWFRWLGDESESGGKIGRFEGGQYLTAGVWRPSKHSMMISIGYYFDQVSRERMVERISEQVSLIAASRSTDTPAGVSETLWIEPAHPNSHPLDIVWRRNGVEYVRSRNLPYFRLGRYDDSGEVSVTVTDPTPFVRDPAIREKVLTATRTWKVTGQARGNDRVAPAFTGSTQTGRPIAARETVFVITTHSAGTVFPVQWRLDGTLMPALADGRSFNLGEQHLKPGTHRLTATVFDSQNGPVETREWIVDNTMPTVKYTLAAPTATTKSANGNPHYTVNEEFTMKLEPSDDQKGYVVAEFRLNGDGWHHYYGWPDAPEGTPYKFTPRGTTIKELVYGSLSREGLSPQPWEKREPGYGTHTLDVRAIDAAGNIGPVQTFMVTVQKRQD
jgi:hypothetical protein